MTEDYETALNFMLSPRGQFIMGQALFVSIEKMKTVPEPHTEHSNIRDMEFLMENMFPMYAAVKAAEGQFQQISEVATDESE